MIDQIQHGKQLLRPSGSSRWQILRWHPKDFM